MSFLLNCYSGAAYQEHILPNTDNANYDLMLDHEVFNLAEDICVCLEVVNTVWRFLRVSRGAIVSGKGIRDGKALADGDLLQLKQGERAVSLVVTSFRQDITAINKYAVQKPCTITIGSDPGNDVCYNLNAMVSSHHASIRIDDSGCTVTDTSKNGVYLGARRIKGTERVRFCECINILGLRILWLGNILAIGSMNGGEKCGLPPLIPAGAPLTSGAAETIPPSPHFFRRSPRSIPPLFCDPIEIEAPPQPHAAVKRPLLLTIGPSLTMAIPMGLGAGISIYSTTMQGGTTGMYMYTGIIIAVTSAVIGTGWALANLRYSGKQERKNEELRVARYREYLDKMGTLLSEKNRSNCRSLADTYPAAADCAAYDENSPSLWNRNPSHADFLCHRLGLGTLPFQAPIVIPKERFTLVEDELADGPSELQTRYQLLSDVPVCVDLMEKRIVGIVGGSLRRGMDILRLLAVQIAAGNCYTDVKMVFLYSGKSDQTNSPWAFARWFPHVWSEDRRMRYIAQDRSEQGEVCFALSNIFRNREEADEFDKTQPLPHYVVFVEDPELLEAEPIAKYLLGGSEKLGVTTILLSDRVEQLPNSCTDIIENSDSFTGIYSAELGGAGRIPVQFDHISADEAERFSRRLAPIEVIEPAKNGEIPDSLTFFQLYGVSRPEELDVLDRWRKNRTYQTMQALIGQRAGGGDWMLDIHEKYHGPHGLIAGTTGSGKSETLQTYILSLAINFSPEDVGFFIIDFKGGGMANLFADLPHMVGQISNLSGNQVNRAMVSIKSEIRRRQRIFGEYGVNHIDQYSKLHKAGEAALPIPHLLIIIDEFAELKREEPDFMRELISVAQVGRSLGIHLILATQKPSGTVDDNIWSNARFRLCLRVQDKQDSNDMLHKSDAAFITQAGRGYMQVGNDEIYEMFQSGWSGAEYDEDASHIAIEIASMRGNTGQSAIVGSHFKRARAEQRRTQWLNALAECAVSASRTQGEPEISEDLSALLPDIYREIPSRGFDYPESKTNSSRIVDFLTAWRAAKRGEQNGKDPVNEAVSALFAAGKQLPELRKKTQLTAIVEYLRLLADQNGFAEKFRLWLPVLPEQLYLDQLPGFREASFNGTAWKSHGRDFSLDVPVGLYDDPANQSQLPFVVDIARNGHLAVCGAVVSGKSTFLNSLVYALAMKYSPDEVNFYILDFSSRLFSCFRGLAHVGGIILEDDLDRTGKFFTMISAMLRQRKALFAGGNFSQYRKAHGDGVPAVVVVIDNFAGFKEKTDNAYENDLLSLSREGATYGIFLVISAGGFGLAEIQTRIADNLRSVVCLEMGDKFKYSEVLRTMRLDVLPEANVKGRGLAMIGGAILEYQTALACPAADDYARAEEMARQFAHMNEAWRGRHAREIPCIPDKPEWSTFRQLEAFRDLHATGRYLPYAYDAKDASLVGLDLRRAFCWLIGGKARTGKTNLMQLLLLSSRTDSARRIVFDFQGGALAQKAKETGAECVEDAAAMFQCLQELQKEFVLRNRKKRELAAGGSTDEEIREAMCDRPAIYCMIDDLAEFVQIAYDPPAGIGQTAQFLENAMEKGALHNIYFLACVDTGEMAPLLGRRMFKAMCADRAGIYLGGNVAAQSLFDFSAMPYLEQASAAKVGMGLLPPDEDYPHIREVVLPDARR